MSAGQRVPSSLSARLPPSTNSKEKKGRAGDASPLHPAVKRSLRRSGLEVLRPLLAGSGACVRFVAILDIECARFECEVERLGERLLFVVTPGLVRGTAFLGSDFQAQVAGRVLAHCLMVFTPAPPFLNGTLQAV